MATLLKCKAVFLHVPKTGGTFLRRLFIAMNLIQFDFSRDHADMERVIHASKHYPGNYLLRSIQLRKNLETHVKECYKFCLVRNPFDWYESYWRYMQDKQWQPYTHIPSRTRFGFRQDTWHPWQAIEPLKDPDFNKFIEKVIQQQPGYLSKLYNGYADPRYIDYVGKQETLAKDMQHIFEHLKVSFDPSLFKSVGTVNESKSSKPAWDKDNRQMIYQLEQETFKKYGYEI
jgi:hypothetical protein